VIITDSDHVVLSALKCETVSNKLSGQTGNENANENESENGD